MADPTPPVAGQPALSAEQRESVYRRNFILLLTDYTIFAIALNLIGPTTVIPDFVRKLTDAEILIAISSQMFEIGWLLPQLLVARRLVRVEHKKWWFVGPCIPVRTMILIFSGVIVLLGPQRPGLILVAFLVFYGLAALGDGQQCRLRGQVMDGGRQVKAIESGLFSASGLRDGRLKFSSRWQPEKLWDLHTPQQLSLIHISEPTRPY